MVIGQMASGLGAVPTMGSLKYNREAGLQGIQWPEQEFFTTGGGASGKQKIFQFYSSYVFNFNYQYSTHLSIYL